MKVGDLVKDVDPVYSGEIGIIIAVDNRTCEYKVKFSRASEWLTATLLEVISESRRPNKI